MRQTCRHLLWWMLAAASTAGAITPYSPTTVGADAGTVTRIAHWQIQDSTKAQQRGEEISAADFSTQGWYAASARATVMAALLENGLYPDVFHSDNLTAVQVPDGSGNLVVTPWWYRSEFVLGARTPGQRTRVRTNGVIAAADLWVNGHLVADRSAIDGAYPVNEFDVTPWVHAGRNVIALRVHPADPRQSLSIGWVDWNPTPPDNNMGPWRGVDIVQSGPVALGDPQVETALSDDHARAALTVRVEARNLDTVAHEVVVSGRVADVPLARTVKLAPGQVQEVTFAPEDTPSLVLAHPRLWWPAGMGEQPLYALALRAAVGGADSDRAATAFGIRSVVSDLTAEGYRRFSINGQPLLIRGAGWAPDMFLRDDPARLETEFAYARNLSLNTLRTEGKLEDQRFYELADRDGLLILAGWECCDMWESAAQTGGVPWEAHDFDVAQASMATEARLLRNHPSVIGFLIGSDNAPPPALARLYLDALHAAHWSLPVISAAADKPAEGLGPSGMKMAGPYDWVPPAYWYADKLGGAFGFDSEVSAGADIPRMEDLQRMLSEQEQEALWKLPLQRQYHASAAWSPFAVLTLFDQALARRYGAPSGLADYVAKAQLDNYDNTRAQFEAFNARMDADHPATGVIYWMLNNAWPSLHWHLYDYDLHPAGAYFGAKKANEPLHIQYAYDSREVVLVNHTLRQVEGLRATLRVRDLSGAVRYQRQVDDIALAGNHTRRIATLPPPTGLSTTYFVELDLAAADGAALGRNVYWLSTRADVLDWEHSNWYATPSSQDADLRGLSTLPKVSCQVEAMRRREGDQELTTVTLSLPAGAAGPAVFQHLTLRDAAGQPLVPVLWDDNDVTLWPGESLVLHARHPRAAAAAVVEIEGWNSPLARLPQAAPATAH